MDETEILDKYKIFLTSERTKLDQEYDEANDHQTSLRGFKVRGSFARLEDARDRAKYLRDNVEPAIHAYVVPTGTWFPIDMDADEVQDQEYMLPQLNELMGKYHEGTQARNAHYQERKREMEEAARSGNKTGKQTTKERLQQKLREKKNQQMKKDLEQMKKLTTE